MGIIGDVISSGNLNRASKLLELGQQMERAGDVGPAFGAYNAVHKALQGVLHTGDSAVAPTVYALRHTAIQGAERCLDLALKRGEDPYITSQASSHAIADYPVIFVEWYRAYHDGHRVPWHAPTPEEIAARNRALKAAEERDRQEAIKSDKRDIAAWGGRVFAARWKELMAATARAEGGGFEARKKAEQLYKCPNKSSKTWQEAWRNFGREKVRKLDSLPEEEKQFVRCALPKVAVQGEDANLPVTLGGLVALPVGWAIAAALLWFFKVIMPDAPEGFLSSIFWSFVAIIALVVLIAEFLLKWGAILGTPLMIIYTLVVTLPKALRYRRAVGAQDITLLPEKDLFCAVGGAPLDRSAKEEAPIQTAQQKRREYLEKKSRRQGCPDEASPAATDGSAVAWATGGKDA